jgi:two-component system, cell cycle sensor histidine kinase and response regulator CckA
MAPFKVLLVDDNPDDRALAIHELEKEFGDLQVREIGRAEELEQALSDAGFDAVITDYRLNWSDGLAVLRRVREVEPECPVIMFTGTGSEELAALALKEGLDDYVVKSPVHVKRLPAAVGASVEKIRQRKALSAREARQRTVDEQLLRLGAIVEASDDAIFGLDLEGVVTSWNRGAERIYGFLREEIEGHSYRALLGEEADSELRRILEAVRAGKHIEHQVTLHSRKDGKMINMSLTVSPILDPDGKVTSAAVIGSDITHQINLEQQLRQAQKMEALGTLAGGIAHDFNNILTAIIGHASLLDLELDHNGPLAEHVHQILEATGRATHLTQALLGFSRRAPIETKPVSLNGIIQKVQRLLVMLVKESVALQSSLTPEDPIIMADPGQIEQVLINLASNARDAIDSTGAIRISTSVIDLDERFVRLHGFGVPGRYASLRISDNGSGMDEATRSRIFEPFFTTKQSGKGTGLGLSIVYGIVKQHNGFISCFSEPGQGTTFQIFFPLSPRTLVPEPKGDEITPPRGSETILVAEDDEATRKLDRKILEAYGYQVIEAGDGEEALEQYRAHADRIALLFLDTVMPKKNGREIYDEIRRGNPGVKVLFTSGYSQEISNVLKAEGQRFIAKPIVPTKLLQAVREALDVP